MAPSLRRSAAIERRARTEAQVERAATKRYEKTTTTIAIHARVQCGAAA
jgi:hypothetical protein